MYASRSWPPTALILWTFLITGILKLFLIAEDSEEITLCHDCASTWTNHNLKAVKIWQLFLKGLNPRLLPGMLVLDSMSNPDHFLVLPVVLIFGFKELPSPFLSYCNPIGVSTIWSLASCNPSYPPPELPCQPCSYSTLCCITTRSHCITSHCIMVMQWERVVMQQRVLVMQHN